MREPVRIGIVSTAAVGLVLAILLVSGAMQPVDLLFPGTRSTGAQLMVDDFGEAAIPDRFSYDGQEMYLIARDFPDVAAASRTGILEFRLRRVLQPLLAWPAPAGNATILVLVLSNVIGFGLAAGALADLAARSGRDPRLGYAACVALAFPVIITTTEPLAFGLGLLGLALVDRGRLAPAVAVFALGGLGRETALVMALAGGIVVARRTSWRAGAAVALVPLLPLALWVARLRQLVPADTYRSTVVLGFLDSPHRGLLDVGACLTAVLLMVVAIWRWRDVPLLSLTALGFLACCAFYIGDQFQWHGLPRVSAVGVALGLAALVPRPALGAT